MSNLIKIEILRNGNGIFIRNLISKSISTTFTIINLNEIKKNNGNKIIALQVTILKYK